MEDSGLEYVMNGTEYVNYTVQTTGQEGAVKKNKQLILLENPKGS